MSKEDLVVDRIIWGFSRQDFGEKILRRRRKQRGLTQQQIAGKVGIDQSRISRIEKGERPRDMPTAHAIANAYHLNPQEKEHWIQLFSGIPVHDIDSLLSETLSESTEPDWESARQIVKTWLSSKKQRIPILARQSGISSSTFANFLDGTITLDRESALKLYDALRNDLNQVDRRSFLKAMGLLTLFETTSSVSEARDSADRLLLEASTTSTEMVPVAYDYFINQFKSSVKLVHRTLLRGDPLEAQKIAETTDIAISEILDVIHKPSYRKELLKIRGWLLVEKARIYSATALPYRHTLLIPIESLIAELRGIVRECDGDKELMAIADIYLADAYYILSEYHKSVPLATRALDDIQDPDSQLYALRLLGLGFSHLGKKEEFEKANTKVRGIIEGDQFADWVLACQTLEGFGRGLVYMKGPKASFDYLGECKKIYTEWEKRGERALLARIQLARSGLRVLKNLRTTDSVWEAEGRVYLSMAEMLPFPRHANQLKQLLEPA